MLGVVWVDELGAWTFALVSSVSMDAIEDAGTGEPLARFPWAYIVAGVKLRLESLGRFFAALRSILHAVGPLQTQRLEEEDN